MKKTTKIKNICANRTVRFVVKLLVGIVVLIWAFHVTTRRDVGVIDFALAQKNAKIYQSVIAEQRKYEEQIRIRIAADSADLEKEAKELEQKKNTMKEADYQQKARSLQRRFMAIQNKYRPAIERIVAASQIALKSAEKEIAEAIEKTANEKGIKVLLPVNNVIYANKTADVTDTFVKNLDKLIISVPYPDPTKLGG